MLFMSIKSMISANVRPNQAGLSWVRGPLQPSYIVIYVDIQYNSNVFSVGELFTNVIFRCPLMD